MMKNQGCGIVPRHALRSGQTAVEFLVLVAFMLFVFTAFFLVIQERSNSVRQQTYNNALKGVSDLMVQEVTLAQQVRSGYRREFELPKTVNGESYLVSLYNYNEIVIRQDAYADSEYVVFLPANITVQGASSAVITPGVRYNITKNVVNGAEMIDMCASC
jgi:hypothetical protein